MTNNTMAVENTTRPVFLVGVGRSGTTFAQSLIGAHPEVLTMPETNFVGHAYGDHVQRVFCRGEAILDSRRPARVLRILLGLSTRVPHDRLNDSLDALGEPRERNPLPKGFLPIRRALRLWAETLDSITRERGKRVWLEKTPMHVGYIDEILRVRPDALFLHIVREPAAVVASMIDASRKYPEWSNYSDVAQCVRIWNRSIDFSLRHAGRPGHLLFRYEALVADPQPLLNRIFPFMGLETVSVDELETNRAQVAKSVTAKEEKWKTKVTSKAHNQNKAHEVLTEAERAVVARAARSLAGMCGV